MISQQSKNKFNSLTNKIKKKYFRLFINYQGSKIKITCRFVTKIIKRAWWAK
jgi:hypothetical protein